MLAIEIGHDQMAEALLEHALAAGALNKQVRCGPSFLDKSTLADAS